MKRPHLCILSVFIALCAANAPAARAQNGYDVYHKWINRALMNPAATGSTNYFEFTTIGRKQWVGIDGAPGLWWLHAQNLFPTVSSGVGLSFSNDYIGFYHALNVKISYAYHLRLGPEMALSFGLSGGLLTQGRDNSEVELHNPFAPEFDPNPGRTNRADFDTGAEFRYGDVRIGLSALHFNADAADGAEYSHCRSFNLYGSVRIAANEWVALMPVAYANYANFRAYGEAGAILYLRTPRRYEVSLQRLERTANDYYDRFWAGAQAGFNGSFTAMAGLFITEQWRLGYSFGYHPDLRPVNAATSHEILLSWRIKTSEPRRYLCLEECL